MSDAAILQDSRLATDWPLPRIAWLTVSLLSLAIVLSQIDRIIINLLIQPIKTYFSLSDTEFGTLQGLAFGLCYTSLSYPIAIVADARQRRAVVGFGLACFGILSMGSGLARSYGQLFLVRAGVGIGEASIYPAGYSMISDCFPPRRLGRAMSVFIMSSFFGTGVAYLVGGSVVAMLDGVAPLSLPFVGVLAPWQLAFVIAGLPALLLAPVFFLLPEPRRLTGAVGDLARPSLAEAVRYFWSKRRALLPMFVGMSLVTLTTYAWSIWTPALLIRAYGWTTGDVGIYYGMITLIFGPLGAVLAGVLTDHLAARGMSDAALRVSAFGFLGAAVFGGLAPLSGSATVALLLIAPTVFCCATPYSAFGTALQLAMPNRLRGQCSALYIIIVNLVGIGAGPIMIGLFSDHIFTSHSGVRYSLSVISAVSAPLACAALLSACKPFKKIMSEIK